MENPYDAPKSTTSEIIEANERPDRHGCLTALLCLMILANSLTALSTAFMSTVIKQAYPGASDLQIYAIVLCGGANVICAFALLKWRRWGFYGFLVSSVIAFALNMSMGVGLGRGMIGFVGIAVLYWVLNIGGPRKAWPYLK